MTMTFAISQLCIGSGLAKVSGCIVLCRCVMNHWCPMTCTLFDGVLISMVCCVIICIVWLTLTKRLVSELEATHAGDWILNAPAPPQPRPQRPTSNWRARSAAMAAQWQRNP